MTEVLDSTRINLGAGAPATGTRMRTARATSTPLARAVAAGRMLLGFTFLWAFADKLIGLGYSTTSAKAWIHGGSPTNGFLSHVDVGPFQDAFHRLAGNWLVDWLFMLGLLGIGVALVAGVALRIMAVAGVAMMAMMWAAEWPLARHTSAGALTSSTSPLVDYHVIYAIAMVMIALIAGAGSTWGFGDRWADLPLVQRHPALR